HDRLHFLRHHADIGLLAPIITEAIEAEAVVELAEERDAVLELDVRAPAAAATAETAAAATEATAAAAETTAAPQEGPPARAETHRRRGGTRRVHRRGTHPGSRRGNHRRGIHRGIRHGPSRARRCRRPSRGRV